MTNEELVAAIQAGEQGRLYELWKQMEGLTRWKASRVSYAADLFGGRGVEFEDLYQCGYPALAKAVDTYDPATRGTFASWFMLHLKTAFADITGCRTKKAQLDPLNNSVSLDEPISEEPGSTTLLELVADPHGQDFQDSVEDAVWLEQLGKELDTVLSALPKEQTEVLHLRYWCGMTPRAAGKALGIEVTRLRRIENNAIQRLRAPGNARRLRPFYRPLEPYTTA